MPWAKHWDIRRYIKDFRATDPKFPKGTEARYTLLDYLLLRSNPRLRTYIGVDTMMDDTGFAQEAVTGALGWLFDRGAIYNVPYRFRVGAEAELAPRKYVFQLTGIIRLGENWVRYLLFSEEDAQMMLNEWHSVGMEVQVDEAFFTSKPESVEPAKYSIPSQSKDSQSKGSQKRDLSSTSSSLSSTSSLTAPSGRRVKSLAAFDPLDADDDKLFGSDEKKGGGYEGADISQHPFVAAFLEVTKNATIKSPSWYKEFTKDISASGSPEAKKEIFPCLLVMWDTVPGFEVFARSRMNELVNVSGITPLGILQHLRKLDLVPEQGSTKKCGFFEWRRKNPSYCRTPEQQAMPAAREPEAPPEVTDRPAFELA